MAVCWCTHLLHQWTYVEQVSERGKLCVSSALQQESSDFFTSCGNSTLIGLTCALYGICTQQYLPDGLLKKQCYSTSAAGIVGFHADVLVKLGISVETSRLKASYWEACQIQQ